MWRRAPEPADGMDVHAAGLGAALLGAADGEKGQNGRREGGGEGGGGGIAALVSAKEERDLAALLELFALGVGDVDQFQERLQAELAALEARALPPQPRIMSPGALRSKAQSCSLQCQWSF